MLTVSISLLVIYSTNWNFYHAYKKRVFFLNDNQNKIKTSENLWIIHSAIYCHSQLHRSEFALSCLWNVPIGSWLIFNQYFKAFFNITKRLLRFYSLPIIIKYWRTWFTFLLPLLWNQVREYFIQVFLQV